MSAGRAQIPMSCITPAAGCNDPANRVWYPECYAATPSAVTDWAPYIQCALNDAAAAGGGTVLLGARGISRYAYASTIEVGAYGGEVPVVLKGQSLSATLSAAKPFASTGTNSLIVNPGAVLDTLTLLGNNAFRSDGARVTGVGFGGNVRFGHARIQNVSIQRFTEYGVNFGAGRISCTVSGCVISRNGNSGILVGGAGSTGNAVLNNTIYENGADGIDNGGGSNCTISGNYCYGNGWRNPGGGDNHGILLYASGSISCNDNKILSNRCYRNHGSGIKAYPDPKNPGRLYGNTIDANECHDNGADGISVEACANTLVTNNHLHDNFHAGLYGRSARPPGNTASGNTWCRNGVSDVDAPGWKLVGNHSC